MADELPPIIPFASATGNAFLLPVADGFIAVDPGTKSVARKMVRYVKRLGRRPQSIFLAVATHLHAEHAGGLRDLQRLTHCSAAVHRQARRRPPRARGLEGWLKRPWRLALALQGRTPPHFDRWLSGGEKLPGGWEVVYVPGHTAESIALYHRQRQILLAGDTLVSARGGLWVNPFNEDGEVLAMSLHTLEQLAVLIVYPGHGAPVRGRAALLKALHRRVRPSLQLRLSQRVTGAAALFQW